MILSIEAESVFKHSANCSAVFEVISTEATSESEYVCESDEDFEDVDTQDFRLKSHRKVKVSSVGLSAKARKSLRIQVTRLINEQE